MGLLTKILGAASSDIFDKLAGVVDDLTLSKEEKQTLNLEMQRLVQEQMNSVQRSVQARFDAVRSIIVSEMQSGDKFTQRARPTVVYAGLALFALQVIAQFFTGIPVITIPPDFTIAWASVVGVWSLGRSYEKVKGQNGVSKFVTGSETQNPSIDDLEL